MTNLPPVAADVLHEMFGGAEITSIAPIGGGMVCRAARVNLSSGWSLFAKWHANAPDGMFAAEAAGLEALGRATAWAVQVPNVLHVAPDFLLLDWIEPASPQNAEDFTQRFAEGLAAMHRTTTRTGRGSKIQPYGFASDGFIGTLPQTNTPRTTDWATFYRDCRILPQIALARQQNHLTSERECLLMQLVERLPALLNSLPQESCLIHGDLWSGNFLCTRHNDEDTPYIFDPAAYNGHREMELAYMELFGGFPPGFVEVYVDTYPLDEGYNYRRALHQLYPLLVHLNYFGERYGPAVERVCREYMV